MNFYKRIETLRPYFPFYLFGALLVIGMKYYYSRTSCDGLLWILTPTARLVSAFSGIPFTYEADAGYVSHELRFIIAASCSGVQFLIITTAVLIFSFVRRMGFPAEQTTQNSYRRFLRSLFWTMGSIGAAYLLTVSVNSLRIILSVYLPVLFQNNALSSGVLTPERLHTMIGTAVYFAALLTIYHLADDISLKIAQPHAVGNTGAGSPSCFGGLLPFSEASPHRPFIRLFAQAAARFLPPVFWYFLIVLGLPYLNGAYRKNKEDFGAFALLVFLLCAAILCLFCVGSLARKQFVSGKKIFSGKKNCSEKKYCSKGNIFSGKKNRL